jgi:hypothetical protein
LVSIGFDLVAVFDIFNGGVLLQEFEMMRLE